MGVMGWGIILNEQIWGFMYFVLKIGNRACVEPARIVEVKLLNPDCELWIATKSTRQSYMVTFHFYKR